jgi:peptidoglycan hydrolase-like protein with peptidoglycan-binding domain
MSSDPATARAQGSTAATNSANAAEALGLPAGSALYNDIEGYPSTAACKAAVLSFLSGWTNTLHQRGFLSGFYSSAGSGIKDAAAAYNDAAYTRVDHIWYAWWNDAANTDTGTYVPASYWANHQRIHQYHGGITESYGGVSINIDRNYLDLTAGTPVPPSACTTVGLDFTAYPQIASGASGAAVKAAQCVLKSAGFSPGSGDPTGTFDAGTVAAAKAFQSSRGLVADGVVGARTWTALLSAGTTPALNEGSTGAAVSRLQRSLTAALSRTVGIDGTFGPQTTQAVRDFQTSRGLGTDGIVGAQTWTALQAGR